MLPLFLPLKNNSCNWPVNWWPFNRGIQMFWELFLRGVHSVPPGKSKSSFRVLPQTLNLVLASYQEAGGNNLQDLQILVFYSAIILAM